MKNKKLLRSKKGLLFTFMWIFSLCIMTQNITVEGIVKDFNGEPLPGVTVVIKGTTKGTTTDLNGNFTLSGVSKNTTLQFSFIGMGTQEILIGNRSWLNVVLVEESVGLQEVVAVGYGVQKKVNLTGSVASIQAEDLDRIPVASSSNALTGKLPGLIAQQVSGQPGQDAASLNIRGFGNALFIVDGVESSFDNIDVNQIESVSVLKDASASIYGARAGNGVILVTTKRGKVGKPSITLNGTYTLQKPTYLHKALNSGEYTTLERELHLNTGKSELTAPYTSEQIQKYYEATEPGYYNTDWSKKVLNDNAPMQHYNLSLRGGAEAVNYYVFAGFLNQDSFWKKNGGDYNRYNFQGAIDANITDNLTMEVNVQYIVDKKKSTHRPQNRGGYLFEDMYNNKPIYPDNLPDPTKIPYSGAETGGALVQSNRELGGYSDDDFDTFSGGLTLNYDFNYIKGLSFKVFGNYKNISHHYKSFARPVSLYTYNVDNEDYELVSTYQGNSPLDIQRNENQAILGQFSLNYTKSFNQVHDVSGMALYEVNTYESNYLQAGRSDFTFPNLDQLFAGSGSTMSNDGSASEMGRASYIFRLNYGYKEKYLTEMIFRADASAKFPKESRWGYFPSISVGWRLSEENFMKEFNALDNLKLRLSYGQSGYDGVANFAYLAGYNKTLMSALWGDQLVMGVQSRGMANPTLTWEEMSIYNIGVDYSWFNRMFYGEIDVFYRERTGIPATRTVSLPSTFGVSLPVENINSQNSRGFELKIGSSGYQNNLKWDISANVAFQRAKWDHFEEVDYTDPDEKRINQKSGQWVDRTFGYKTVGLFTSFDQIENLDFDYPTDAKLMPGDIHYVDTNDDGVLDWKDVVEIGKGQMPNWTTGLSIYIGYKDFDMSALLQGAHGHYKRVSLSSRTKTFFNNRWTEENNDPNALFPLYGGAGPNYLSDRNFMKADYMRLKNITFGYHLPSHLAKKIMMESARVYIGGTNLLTFSKLGKYNIDPEAPYSVQDGQPTSSYYPQQKSIMAGISLKF